MLPLQPPWVGGTQLSSTFYNENTEAKSSLWKHPERGAQGAEQERAAAPLNLLDLAAGHMEPEPAQPGSCSSR